MSNNDTKHDDWLSRRERAAYSRGMLVERQASKPKDKAFSDIMLLLGCDANTQFSSVPGMVKKLIDRLAKE